jgi:hypothetical protein
MKFIGRSRRNRGRSQRGGATWVRGYVGGSRRNRGRSQRGCQQNIIATPSGGGSRRNRGRSQRGGIDSWLPTT